MEESRYPVKFICDHDCENCLIKVLSVVYDIKNVDSIHSCRTIMHTWFNGEVITREKYNNLLTATKKREELLNNYEKFNCPSSRSCNLCKYCEVYDYLTSLGYESSGLTNAKFRNFKIQHDTWKERRCKSCIELMKELCGVEVYRTTFTEIPEVDASEIDGFKDRLEEVIEHGYAVQTHKCEPGDILPKDAIRTYTRKPVHKKKPEPKCIMRTINQPQPRVNDKPASPTGSQEWVPPFKYVGDSKALSVFAREFAKLHNDICRFFGEDAGEKFIADNHLKSLSISEGREIFKQAIKLIFEDYRETAEADPRAKDLKFLSKIYNQYRNRWFDLETDKCYNGPLSAPICCGDCKHCLINKNIYKPHGITTWHPLMMKTKCHQYAETYSDEIADLFGYIKIKDYVSLKNIYPLMYAKHSFEIKTALRHIIVEKQLREKNLI